MPSYVLCISLPTAQLTIILTQNPQPDASEFFERAFFTYGLENCEKYAYVADKISPSWKCLVSAVTYYPIVAETRNTV